MDRLQEILSGLNFMGHTSKAYTPEEINKEDFIVRRGKKSYAKIVIK
jgi:hypothetical protein